MAKKAINEYDNCCVKYSKWLHSAHASLIIWRMNATACYLERTSSETLYSPKTELQPPNRLWFDRSSQFVALNRYENKQCQQFHMKIFLQCLFFSPIEVIIIKCSICFLWLSLFISLFFSSCYRCCLFYQWKSGLIVSFGSSEKFSLLESLSCLNYSWEWMHA